MRVESVGSADGSTARQIGLEIWRTSMSQKVSREVEQRISGREPERLEPRRVEPAVKIEISDRALQLTN